MNSDRLLLLSPVLLLMLAAGCTPELDPTALVTDDGAGTLVVDALLIVDEPLSQIILSRTLPADEPFILESAAVKGATVTVIMGNEGVLTYSESWSLSGAYTPNHYAPPLVRPATTYQLIVETRQGEMLTAATTTPQRFNVDSWVLLDAEGESELRTLRTFGEIGLGVYEAPENQLVYAEGLLEAQFSGTTAATLGAAGFQLALFSLDPGSDYVIDPPFLDDEDFEALDRVSSSPAIIAENSRVRLPWFGIFFEGRHVYRLLAVDANWFDYIRSLPQAEVGLGFGGNAGDGFAGPIFQVEGGIGLFGSAAIDEIGFRVLPAP